MGEKTNIQWTDATGGPWLGCTEVSPGCAHCYARELMERRLKVIVRKAYKASKFEDWETRPVWGDKAPRVMTKGFWSEIGRLNTKAGATGKRLKVFPSMIDWLDNMPAGIIDQDGNWLDRAAVLAKFMAVIHACQNLDFLLLTKRPENFSVNVLAAAIHLAGYRDQQSDTKPVATEHPAVEMVYGWVRDGSAPKNVWVGASTEDQKRADERVDDLLAIPAPVRFLSAEPLLGPIDFRLKSEKPERLLRKTLGGIDWIIFGGESGPGSRPCNLEWIRDGVRQCHEAGIKAFCKQLGGNLNDDDLSECATASGKSMKDKKGGDMSEWPEDLRIREMPDV